MKLRTILIVVVLLAALSGAVYYAGCPAPTPPADQRLGQSLVDRTVIEKAAKLRFSDQGKTVTLVRQADGTWCVASYFDLPADFQKLSGFIGNLTDAKLERLVTSSAERIARLDFKDTKITLLDSSDREVWSVTLGKNPETGTGRFVRFGTEKKAFLASLNAWLDIESKNWAHAELLNLKPDTIAKLEIPFVATSASESATVTFTRAKKEDPWVSDKTPSGQKVKADKISSVLSSVGTIRFSETSDLTDASVAAAKAHARSFALTTFEGKTVTVSLGRKPEEKKIKPPVADPKSSLAALGTSADLTKKDKQVAAVVPTATPPAPEYETTPAGPVFVTIAHSDATAPVNALMQKRAFQINDYTFTGLPQIVDELFEPAPPAVPPVAVPVNPEERKKP